MKSSTLAHGLTPVGFNTGKVYYTFKPWHVTDWFLHGPLVKYPYKTE